MSKETGGPAFPNVPNDIQYETWDEGMTLRDYAAIKAMASLIGRGHHHELIASLAYEMADAMLEARK